MQTNDINHGDYVDVSLDMQNALGHRCFTAYHSNNRLKYVAVLQAMDWLNITILSAMFVDIRINKVTSFNMGQ